MKGNNEFMLNEATLIEAMQMYLSSKFQSGEVPNVTSIEPVADGPLWTFRVRITDEPPRAGE
jgi:hypothetical protein